MSGFIVTPEALADLEQIVEDIAKDNVRAAIRVRNELEAAFERLAETPGMGHYREDLLDRRHRFSRVFTYLIVYRWEVDPIQILAVVHGSRDLPRLFSRRGIW